MTEFRRTAPAAVTLALLLAPMASFAETPAGSVAAVNPDARSRSAPGAALREVKLGDQVIMGQVFRTDAAGSTFLALADGSSFTIGPNSELVIDRFVYNPESGTADLAATAARGVFRFIGGAASKGEAGAQLRTPIGTAGIRGAIATLSISTAPNGGDITVQLGLDYGNSLTFNPTNGGPPSSIGPGGSLSFTASPTGGGSSSSSDDSEGGNSADSEGSGDSAGTLPSILSPSLVNQLKDIANPAPAPTPTPSGGGTTPGGGGTTPGGGGTTPGGGGTTPGGGGTTPAPLAFERPVLTPFVTSQIFNGFIGGYEGSLGQMRHGFTTLSFGGDLPILGWLLNFPGEMSQAAGNGIFNTATDTWQSGRVGVELQRISPIELCDCDWLSWGTWVAPSDLATGLNRPDNSGYWVVATPPDPAQIPLTGTATYSGSAVGQMSDFNGVTSARGGFNAEADFANRLITSTITDFNGYDFASGAMAIDVQGGFSGEFLPTGPNAPLNSTGVSGSNFGQFSATPNDPVGGLIGSFSVNTPDWSAGGIYYGARD